MVEKGQKTWKTFVGKGFFGFWRLHDGSKRWYLHRFVHLPGTKPVTCDVFGPCTLQSGVFPVPPVFKSGRKPRYLQFFIFFVAARQRNAERLCRKEFFLLLEISNWPGAAVWKVPTGFCPQSPVDRELG